MRNRRDAGAAVRFGGAVQLKYINSPGRTISPCSASAQLIVPPRLLVDRQASDRRHDPDDRQACRPEERGDEHAKAHVQIVHRTGEPVAEQQRQQLDERDDERTDAMRAFVWHCPWRVGVWGRGASLIRPEYVEQRGGGTPYRSGNNPVCVPADEFINPQMPGKVPPNFG